MLRTKHKTGRNELCPCGSGLKSKHCHSDPSKQEICNRVANEKMVQLIMDTKRKKGIPIEVVCINCGGVSGGPIENCDVCNRTGVITESKAIKIKYDILAKKGNKNVD